MQAWLFALDPHAGMPHLPPLHSPPVDAMQPATASACRSIACRHDNLRRSAASAAGGWAHASQGMPRCAAQLQPSAALTLPGGQGGGGRVGGAGWKGWAGAHTRGLREATSAPFVRPAYLRRPIHASTLHYTRTPSATAAPLKMAPKTARACAADACLDRPVCALPAACLSVDSFQPHLPGPCLLRQQSLRRPQRDSPLDPPTAPRRTQCLSSAAAVAKSPAKKAGESAHDEGAGYPWGRRDGRGLLEGRQGGLQPSATPPAPCLQQRSDPAATCCASRRSVAAISCHRCCFTVHVGSMRERSAGKAARPGRRPMPATR
eukprot:67506-Chlamydomonas_euryale.AAC.6